MSSVPQIVVESLTSYEAAVGFTDECPAADRAGPLLPSVQLSPNWVWEDYDFDTIDVFPMYVVSPRNDGYFPSVSPISSPNAMNIPDSPVTPATSSVMNEATGSFDSAVGSPVTSLSITDYAADLTLLSLILLPEVMLLKPVLAPVWPNPYPGYQPSPAPALSVPLPHDDLPGGGCYADGYVSRDEAASPEISRVHRRAGVGPVVGSSPGRVASGDGPQRSCCDAVTAGLWAHDIAASSTAPSPRWRQWAYGAH